MGPGSTAQGGAPVRPAPNLYAAETLPVARRSLEGTRGVPALLAAAKPEPAEEDLFDKALGLVDERSGFKSARQSWRALFEGDFKGALAHPLIPFDAPGGALGDELLGPKDARQAVASRPPSVAGRGARRVVVDQDSGRAFYTWNQYEDFVEVLR